MPPADALLVPAVAAAAFLYASVGHGGASAYLALLALAGRARPEIAATVLVMNLLVAGLASWRYAAAGHLDIRFVAAFLAFSAPAAFAGGITPIPARAFAVILGLALIGAGARLLLPDPRPAAPRTPAGAALWRVAAAVGTPLGFLSGLTGVGGGIYLSPLILLLGWKDAKGTAAASAAFIWVNSATGLAGRLVRGERLDAALLPLVAAAVAGGFAGARWGADRAAPMTLRRLLGLVLLVAAAKLLAF